MKQYFTRLHINPNPLLLLAAIAFCFMKWGCTPSSKTPVQQEVVTLKNKTVAKKDLDSLITTEMKAANIPGLSVAVVKDSSVVYQNVFGVRELAKKMPVNQQTVFEAASLSKPVFAYVVLKLAQEGLLDLDKPLYNYMLYPDIKDDERYKLITARMVLSHTTGFPNWRRNSPLSISFEPGSKFSYSGEGYIYLQKVVEHLTRKSFDSLVREMVFVPLQMTDSYFAWNDTIAGNLAIGYDKRQQEKPKWKPGEALSAGSLHTTATDYAKFLVMLMHDKDVMALMAKPESVIPDFEASVAWGLGVGLEMAPQGTWFWHWGSNDGYKAFVLGNPQSKSAMVYLTNSDNGLTLVDNLSCYLFGGEHQAFEWLKQEHGYTINAQCN